MHLWSMLSFQPQHTQPHAQWILATNPEGEWKRAVSGTQQMGCLHLSCGLNSDINFILNGKNKNYSNILYCNVCFTAVAWIHTYKTSTVCLKTESKRFKGAHLPNSNSKKTGVTKPVPEKKRILNIK